MTKAEAEALWSKWKDRRLSWPSDQPACRYPNQELEWRENGHLMRNYCCTDCDELLAKQL